MIQLFKPHTPKRIDNTLLETLHSGYITQGPKVEEFEERLASFIGTANVATVNSGTSALTLALRLAGVGPDDEVINTPMTCTATNLPVLTLGGKLVFADIDPKTGNISAESVAENVTKKTKAILFVDWGGDPADLDAIMEIAKKHKLKVIEDAAHAFGGEYKGLKIGMKADFTCFSFQAIKHITTGDGGLIVTKDPADAKRAKVLRWFGIDRDAESKDTRIDQDITEAGYKMHMNDLNATIGIVQMDYIEKILQAHRQNARYYIDNLDPFFSPVQASEGSAWWLFTMLLPTKKDRDDFKKYAEANDVQASQVHKRNDEYSVFKPFAKGKKFPALDKFADRMICIPVHWDLSTEDRAYIVSMCNNFAENRGKK